MNKTCAYCGTEDEDDGWGWESTPRGPMHESCYIDWRDDA